MKKQQKYSDYLRDAAYRINLREAFSFVKDEYFRIIQIQDPVQREQERSKLLSACQVGQGKAIMARLNSFSENDLDLIDKPLIYIRPAHELKYDDGEYEKALSVERHLRKQQKRLKAVLALESGVIGGKFGGFNRATMWQINEQKQKNINTEKFLRSHAAIGKNGESIGLANSFERKMAEFAIVAQGVQKVAEHEGMNWAKIVVSLPPEFHINPTHGENSWDGTLPDEACRILATQWARLRSALSKDDIKLTGLWTRETHLDGTPHINFLIYIPLGSEQVVEQKFRDYMSLGNTSPKAIKFEKKEQYQYDGACGFAKYAAKGFAKYSAKNLEATDENIDALAEQSLASAFGWRRWGFFGIPPLSQWRALRSKKDNPNSTPLLNSLWRAARSNDFASFIQLNGGLGGKARDRAIATFAEPSESGKSKIVVGVWEKSTGKYLKTKQIGYFQLMKIDQNQEVTLKITYPREEPKSYLNAPAPPLIH